MNTQIYAHRGASGYAPENTLEAFELAAKMGAQGVELDVHITKDGHLVVAHDETIDRVSDSTGFIRDMTLEQLKHFTFNKTHPEYKDARIPTLKEVFDLLRPTGLFINIEMKNSVYDYPNLEQKTIDLAREENMIQRVIFSSFNHYSLQRIKAIDPALPCGLLYEANLVRPWAYAVALGVEAIHPHFSEVVNVPDECALSHKAGIAVNTWTVNSEEDIRSVLRAGSDIIITNYPDRALNCLK